MFKKIVTISALIIFLIVDKQNVAAQDFLNQLTYQSRTSISSQHSMPFWLWANKRGKFDRFANNQVVDVYYKSDRFQNGDFYLEWGVDLTGIIAKKNSLSLSQAYLTGKYKGFKLTAGRYYRQQAFNDSPIGLGSMVIGRHASAMPGIEFYTDDFISIPFSQGYVKFKANFSHHWFENDRYIKDAYLHSKEFYLRIDLGRLKLSAGMIHNVVWGGVRPDGTSLGRSFDDFIRVVTGRGAGEDHFSMGEQLTALGNTVAAYDTGILWISDFGRIQATRLFFLEDKSALLFRSAWDGQWTLDVEPAKSKYLKHFRYDYLFTIRQDAFANQPGGRANYYGHGIYRSGWSYFNKVLGVPLITLNFQENGQSITTNNMMVAQSIASQFYLNERILLGGSFLYSRNYGTCRGLRSPEGYGCRGSIEKDIPLDVVQRHTVRKDYFLMAAELEVALKSIEGLKINTAIGYDVHGFDFTGNQKANLGVLIGFKYTANTGKAN